MSHHFMINSCFVPDQLSCCQTGHGPDTFSDGCTVSRYALYRPVIIATIRHPRCVHYIIYITPPSIYPSRAPLCAVLHCTGMRSTHKFPSQEKGHVKRQTKPQYVGQNLHRIQEKLFVFIQCNQHVYSQSSAISMLRVMVNISRLVSVS